MGPNSPAAASCSIDGRAPQAGEIMRIPTLAETMRGIAAQGKDYVYKGEFAHKLSEHVQRYGGWITPDDMAAHKSTWDEPITADYRGVRLYECPPNGQGLAAIIAANMAGGYDLAALPAADRLHLMVEIMRLAFADAQQWVCDPLRRGHSAEHCWRTRTTPPAAASASTRCVRPAMSPTATP